jgi:hypothetical protein
VLYEAGSLLESGDNCAGKSLVLHECRTRKSQDKRERGFWQQNLNPSPIGADPQDFAHMAPKSGAWLVDEMRYFAHYPFWMSGFDAKIRQFIEPPRDNRPPLDNSWFTAEFAALLVACVHITN